MRVFWLGAALLNSLFLLIGGGLSFFGVVAALPSIQAVQLALTGSSLRYGTYDRALSALEGSQNWLATRENAASIGLLHFNLASRQRNPQERDQLYSKSHMAFRESLQLSPLQPISWLLTAELLSEQGRRKAAAQALQWAMKSGYFIEPHRTPRTELGLALWDLLDHETRERLIYSIVTTFKATPDIVTLAALRAGIIDELVDRLRSWPAPDRGPNEGWVLAAKLEVAAYNLRRTTFGAIAEETDDMHRWAAAFSIFVTTVPLFGEAMTVDEYLKATRGEDAVLSNESVEDYLVGVVDALLVLNEFNRMQGMQMFCLSEQDMQIYDFTRFRESFDSMLAELERDLPNFDTVSKTNSVGLAALQAMTFLHPCEAPLNQADGLN